MQRSLYIKNKTRRIVQGIFYPEGKGGVRLKRKIATFAEADLAPDGEPLLGHGHMTEKKRVSWLEKRHAEFARSLRLEPRDALFAGENLRKALQEWIIWGESERARGTVKLMGLASRSLMEGLNGSEQRKLKVAQLNLRHVDKWLHRLRQKGLAAPTLNVRINPSKFF